MLRSNLSIPRIDWARVLDGSRRRSLGGRERTEGGREVSPQSAARIVGIPNVELVDGLALATVVTYNYLHTALNLIRTIRRTWSQQPHIYIALVDHVDKPRPGFEQ